MTEARDDVARGLSTSSSLSPLLFNVPSVSSVTDVSNLISNMLEVQPIDLPHP